MSDSFTSIRPIHPLLREVIAYVYFETYKDQDFQRKYSFFPHVYTTISFYKEADCHFNERELKIFHSGMTSPLIIATQQQSIHTVVQSGPIQKIAIAFKPLGLNHFIQEDYAQLLSAERQLFKPNDLERWREISELCFESMDFEEAMQVLEAFLLEKYNEKNIKLLKNVLPELSDCLNQITVGAIADREGLSRRTLLRHFKKHLRMSPELFRSILRFRYAVKVQLSDSQCSNLTSLAHQSGFTDQSHMIRTFKKLTGSTPRQFFNRGVQLGQEDTFWFIHP